MSEIFPWLYISDIKTAKAIVRDNYLNVQKIIDVGNPESYSSIEFNEQNNFNLCKDKNIEYYVFRMCDYGSTRFSDSNFLKIMKVLEDSKNRQIKTLVHCSYGINRSPTCVIYFLMHSYQIDLKTALEKVIKLHPKARPNNFYMSKLINSDFHLSISYEEILYLFPDLEMKKMRNILLEKLGNPKLDIDIQSFSKYRGFDGPNILLNHLYGLYKNFQKFKKYPEFTKKLDEIWTQKILKIRFDPDEQFISSNFTDGILNISINPKCLGKEEYTGADILTVLK